MSKLIITELSLVGFELFQDSESFLEELTDDELDNIEGGKTIVSFHSNGIHFNSVGNDVDLEGLDKEDLNKPGIKGNYGLVQTVNFKTVKGHTVSNVVSMH